MPLFVISFKDKPDAGPLRAATRDEHLAYMSASGIIKLGGPYLNGKAEPIGSLIIVEAADEAQVRAFMKDEPYYKAGVMADFEVTPWRYTAGQLP